MPRLIEDPNLAVCPNYDAEEWHDVRQDMINAFPGEPPLTNEAAAAQLRATWVAMNNRDKARWNEQMEEDRQMAAEQREEEAQRMMEAEREREEQRKEQEKKKPKVKPFNPNRSVANWLPRKPSAFAMNKLQQIEYVELDYFTPRGCDQAQSETIKTSKNDTYSITMVDDIVGLQPISSLKPSKSIRRDEELSWEDFILAKNTMLHFIAKTKVWPQEHVVALASFFVILETHPLRQEGEIGNQALVTYASRVRREWFEELKRAGDEDVFDIQNINENLLQAIAGEVKDRARNKEIEEVSNILPKH